ncbi:Zinc uptake regulation protein ZUR [Rubellimicrobium mesophilum DSM 19309]|uniref:Zinc uptake regulation protein ZUR n=1 Tax=Rubellimicrobium mesophilum DSM 19309 TaxID=442562 RepID=A0A017HU24_9RHOB|nr:Zinc uptake regulation protein ZUR [Rubellimicrobium mesophilum DSM 19309]
MENGFAHRIEGLSAYVACARPGAEHAPSFLVCRCCRRVAEEAIAAPLGPEAEAEGFAIERTVVEAQGLCPACRGRA